MDHFYYPYPSRRQVVFANKGMVATSQLLAAQAGLHALRAGGNAVDAAVAAAACLTVVEPTSNGIGGDAFALVWAKGRLHGLNASGPSPFGLTYDMLKGKGLAQMPDSGWLPVTVPGAPAAWSALHERFGKLSFAALFEPAIEYAQNGYPVSPVVSRLWKSALERFKQYSGDEFLPWFSTFAPTGQAPTPGETVRLPGHAASLKAIAQSRAQDFYRGELAEKIIDFAQKTGGYLRLRDLAEFAPEWVDPIGINYRGYEVWEIPPNGHGLVTLLALNILKGFDFDAKESVDTYHRQMEAIKLAFADGLKYIGDPRFMQVSVPELLAGGYAAERRKLIGNEALAPATGTFGGGGTVYLATADGEGNMVSYIQSNYKGFGSGLVVPGTGIALQDRGANFSLVHSDANCFAPGKKPYHTIIPGFLTKNNQPVGPFGVMGAFMQPQGHLQVVVNTADFLLNPQAALDAPRWQWISGKTIQVEPQFPDHIAQALARRGHDIVRTVDGQAMGRGQIIWRDAGGTLMGATEPRADGAVCAW
ncbi:MAG: gamma-glutamyltransferase family protein [Acidaminococcales bacterium]|jgi:gamma-glutamyltranspeptidase/glutathione hydrolase|nr:gamma-glutamyltransferase family protein [Acidaminococcales bacterium]